MLLLLLLFLLLLDVPSSDPCISETDLLRQSRSLRKRWVVCGGRTLCDVVVALVPVVAGRPSNMQ